MKTELMMVVERIVRPVGCGRSTKLRMREELYDTLEQIYLEEVAIQPDEAAALTVAAQRLGEGNELRRELEQSLSKGEAYSYWYDRFVFPPAASPWNIARTGVVHALIFGVPVLSAVEVLRVAWGVPDVRLFFATLAALFGVMSSVCLVIGDWALGQEQRLVWRQADPHRGWGRLVVGAAWTGLSLTLAMAVLYWVGDVDAGQFVPWRLGLIGMGGGVSFIAFALLIQRERESVVLWESLVLN